MKYIDLHAHLDGSITLDIAKKLAKMQNIAIPDDQKLLKLIRAPENLENLNDFLKCFEFPLSLLQTEKSIAEAVRLVLENMKNDSVIYTEIMFAPQLHTKNGLSQEKVISAALEGLKNSDLHANLLLCIMRGEGNEKENDKTLELAQKHITNDGGIVGLNLAGAEALYPTENYHTLFEKAKKCGIPFSIHAGEADGAESIKSAIEMGASRIGHGVRAYENKNVVQMIKNRGITLEMCPTSNRLTKAVCDMKKYPFMTYLNSNVKVTINTDDLAIEGTTITKEFQYMEKTFGLTRDKQIEILKTAADAAFTTEKVKAWLKKEIET